MLWPLVSIIVLVVFAIIYSLVIYYIIPQNSIAEFIVRPSLIVIAVLYTILLIRMNAILPKIREETSIIADENEEISEQTD